MRKDLETAGIDFLSRKKIKTYIYAWIRIEVVLEGFKFSSVGLHVLRKIENI